MDDERSSLDSIRTVEFSRMLRGYDCDEVDDFLDRVAGEVEELKLKSQRFEEELRQAREKADVVSASRSLEGAPGGSDAVQRMLNIAERFVEHTKSEAEHEAEELLVDARERAQRLLAEAEERSVRLKEQTERRRVEEVSKLEAVKTQLQADLESLMQHVESERERLKAAMSDLLGLVDEKLRPASSRRPAGGAPPNSQQRGGARQTKAASDAAEPSRDEVSELERGDEVLRGLGGPGSLLSDVMPDEADVRPPATRSRNVSSPE
ncbi:MAG: DivIVA domain-containing protein [Acidimicrobiales bacterium]